MVSIRPERTADAPDPGTARPDSRRARREQARAGQARGGVPSLLPTMPGADRTPAERGPHVPAGPPGNQGAAEPGRARPSSRRRVRARRPRASVGPVPVATLVWLEVALLAGATAVLAVDTVARAVAAGLAVLALVLAVPVGGVALSGQVARRVRFSGARRLAPTRATLASARTRSGRVVGTLDHPPTVGVVIRVEAGRSRLVRVGGAPRVPLDRIVERLTSAGIAHDSVTLLHDLVPGADGRTHLVVRVDPTRAREALEIRGGGRSGLEATLAALAGHVESVLRQADLAGETLDVDALARLEAEAAELAGLEGASETWRALTTSAGTHRVQALTALTADGDLATLPPEVAATVAVRCGDADGGTVATRVAVRFSDARSSATRSASDAAGSSRGLRLTTATGLQRRGVLETTVLGSPEPMGASPRPWPDRWPLLDLAPDMLRRLSPRVGGGVPLGETPDGAPVALVEDATVARLLLALGDARLATGLVGLLVRSGRSVTVATSRPEEWRGLSSRVGPGLDVLEVAPGADLPRGGGDVLVDDVHDAPGSTLVGGPLSRRPGRLVIVVRAQSEGLDPGVLRAADVVLASGLAAPEVVETLLGPGGAAPSSATGLGAGEVLAVEAGDAVVVRLHDAG